MRSSSLSTIIALDRMTGAAVQLELELVLTSHRSCKRCGVTMPSGKRPHAIYCTRKCKTAASEQRRPVRDHHARYLKEREYRLKSVSAYQKANPHVPKRAKGNRRARIKGNGRFVVTSRDWLRLVNRYHGCCFYCGASGRMSMDHVVPLSRGGVHSIGNLVPACVACNSSKRTRTIVEWRRRIGLAQLSSSSGGRVPLLGEWRPPRTPSEPLEVEDNLPEPLTSLPAHDQAIL